MKIGLRARIVLIATGTMIFSMGAIIAVSGRFFTEEYTQALASRSLAIGESVKIQLERLLQLTFTARVSDLVGFDEQCRDIVKTYEGMRYAMVVDPAGLIAFHSDPSKVGRRVASVPVLEALAEGQPSVRRHEDDGLDLYSAVVPVLRNGQRAASVVVGFDAGLISGKAGKMLSLNLSMGLLFVAAGVAALLASLSTFVTGPLAKLVAAIENMRVGGGEAPHRIRVSSTEETDAVARAFNDLMAQLETTTVSKVHLEREVEERKHAQAVLQERSQELARSNADLERLAYVASHDLQEPLRMVASYLQLVEKRYKGQLDADGKEFIGYAVDGAKRMQTLINDLLAYSRAGTQAAAYAPVDVARVVETVKANLRMVIHESGVRISHGSLPTVVADATQLTQVLQNLVANAIKFRRDYGPEVNISCEPVDGFWRFTVSDNGIGIEPKYFERIFVLFQRLHSRKEYPGTGIGLAICKRVVERHGGQVDVHSVPGQGSTFSFTIPRREMAAAREEAVAERSAS